MIRTIAVALLAHAVVVPGAARAQDPLATTDPAERAVLPEAAAAVAGRPPNLPALDAVLAKLSRPTPLRGMVQSVRALALAEADRRADAMAALNESLRLLPERPEPKLIGAYMLTFAGAPQRAADLWMEASRISPERALMSDDYVMSALVGRLRDMGDRERADRLQARMAEIGFANALAPARSAAALARTRAQVVAGDAEGAFTAIANPADLQLLMIDRRYEALWPRIEEWAGSAMQDQSRRYLEELRREWSNPRDYQAATNYARRLAGAGAYQAVVALFLPVLEDPALTAAPGVEFLTPVVARALLAVGRRADAERLIARVAALIPDDGSGRSLNLLASPLTLDTLELRWAEAVPRATAFLARAEALGPTVNSSAILQVRSLRGCALWNLRRRDEAAADMAAVMLAGSAQPWNAWGVLRCRGDKAAARDFLVQRVQDPATRDWALQMVQPRTPDDVHPLNRLEYAFLEEVRRDPAVVAAAEKVGRILPQPVADGLPPGFDPFAVNPAVRRAPGTV